MLKKSILFKVLFFGYLPLVKGYDGDDFVKISENKSNLRKSFDLFDFRYKATIKEKSGTIPYKLMNVIENEKLFKNSNNKIHNAYALKDRVNNCIKFIEKQAKSFGYFDVNITYSIKSNSKNKSLVDVVIDLDLGEQYKLDKVNIACNKCNNLEKTILKKYQNFTKKGFSVDNILEIAHLIENKFKTNGYPYAEIEKQEIFLDRKNKTITVKYTLILKERIYFGETKILKDVEINDEFIKNRLLWKEGTLYDKKLIQMTSHLLSNSQIFSDIVIDLDDEHSKKNESGELLMPVKINLKKEKPRALEMSLSYSTTKKDGFFKKRKTGEKLRSFTGRIKWTHYNMFSKGMRLSVGAEGNPHNFFKRNEDSDYELFSEFEVPDVIVPCDNILYTCLARQEYTNAYYKKGQLVSSVWTIPPTFSNFKLQLGATLEINTITNPFLNNNEINKESEHYQSVSFPLYIAIDKRDSVLNPKRGWYVYTNIVPMLFFAKCNSNSTLSCLSGSIYKSFGKKDQIVISNQSSIKYLLGGTLNKIPYDKRLYAGGQGSLRGYSNQMAGETLHDYKYPTGGKAVFEIKNEIRINANKKFGVAFFLETANVSKTSLLSNSKWYSSYGIGLRYNTIVGPLRFDIATPIKRRKKIDRRYQIYISLGQAF